MNQNLEPISIMVKKMDEYYDRYENKEVYSNEMLLDTFLAVYGARKASLDKGDLETFEDNSLKLGVLRSVILNYMAGVEHAWR